MSRLVISTLLMLGWTFSGSTLGASNNALTRFAQETTFAKPAEKVLNLPADTVIFAKLVAELNTAKCKPGDRVEAEITQEVKAGHEKLLERGWHVIGQVAKTTGADKNGIYDVWIVFDNVAVKHDDPLTLNIDIQAISAPETGDNADPFTVMGIPVNKGGTQGPHEELTAQSRGAIRLPGLTLMSGKINGRPVSVLACKGRNIRLVKGSQLAFRAVNP